MKEMDILKTVMLNCCRGAVRLFRQNTGTGWVGVIVGRTKDTITLKNPRPLNAGLCVGSSDLIGWKSVVITPDMLGKRVAIFTALEVKTEDGRATGAQRNFISNIRDCGGISGIVRSVEDALEILGTCKAEESQ